MVKQNRHYVSDLRATALCQWQSTQPRFNFYGSDIVKFAPSPLRNNPSTNVNGITSLCGIATPRIASGQFTLLKMVAKLRNRHSVYARALVGPVDFGDQPRDCVASGFFLRVINNCSDHPFAVNAIAIRGLL